VAGDRVRVVLDTNIVISSLWGDRQAKRGHVCYYAILRVSWSLIRSPLAISLPRIAFLLTTECVIPNFTASSTYISDFLTIPLPVNLPG